MFFEDPEESEDEVQDVFPSSSPCEAQYSPLWERPCWKVLPWLCRVFFINTTSLIFICCGKSNLNHKYLCLSWRIRGVKLRAVLVLLADKSRLTFSRGNSSVRVSRGTVSLGQDRPSVPVLTEGFMERQLGSLPGVSSCAPCCTRAIQGDKEDALLLRKCRTPFK